MNTEEYMEKWRKRTEFCKKHINELTEWEVGFIDSIDEWLSKNKSLSFKQSSTLNVIYHKVE